MPNHAAYSHRQVALHLARYALLEAWRERMLWIALVLAGLIVLAGLFISQLPITEGAHTALSFNAALLRVMAVVLVILRVVGSTVRLYNDKVLDWLLSLPLTRPTLVMGLFAGHALFAVLLALICAVVIMLSGNVSVGAVLQWGIVLVIELLFITAAALMFAIVLANWAVATLASVGLYVLSRIMGGLLLQGTSRLQAPSAADQVLDTLLHVMSWVLPRLDTHLSADQLIQTHVQVWHWSTAHALVLSLLFIGVTCLDLQRKNL